jgi:DNA-binding CsgD family transcriptional regulator/tetratricopeptide (TPR) repeat protein
VPNGQPQLVGRTAEVAALEVLLDRSRLGEPTLAFVEGELGIGKSRLVDAIADRVRQQDGLVIGGGAPPTAGEALPFGAVTRLLRDVLRQIPTEERNALVRDTPELRNLQPTWQIPGLEKAALPSLTVLCEQVLNVIDRVAADRPVTAVMLDDLQWADPATLDLITYVARSPREARVSIFLAARVDEAAADSPVHRLRAELLRIGGVRVALGPLTDVEAGRVLDALGEDSLSPGRRRRIIRLAQGNPLFLRELVAARDTGSGALPESLVALIETRLAALPETQRDVLRVVSVASDGIPGELVMRVVGRPPDVAYEDIRRLANARLLDVPQEGIVSVTHPMVREVVIAGMLDAERRQIHGAIAKVLSAEPGLDPRPESERLIRLADHWHAAGDRVRALPALARAAEAARDVFAFRTAFDLYRRTLEHLETADHVSDQRRLGFRTPAGVSADPGGGGISGRLGSTGATLAGLRRRAADAAILAGEPEVALAWIDAALAEVGTTPARDELELVRARALVAIDDSAQAVETFEAVLARGADVSASARVGLARALVAAGRAAEGATVGHDALGIARAGGSRSEEEAALLVLGTALMASGDLAAGVERLNEARSLRQTASSASALRPRASRVIDLTAGLVDAARVAHGAGLGPDAMALADDAAVAAARWGAEAESARVRITQAAAAIDDGRWDQALAILDELVDRGVAQIGPLALRARIAALRGAWDRAAADLSASEGVALVRSSPQDRAAFSVALTELRYGRRQLDAAAAAATEGLLLARDAPVPDRLELIALATRVHVDAARAARALRAGVEEAEHVDIGRALASEAERLASGGPRVQALVATIKAELVRLRAGDVSPWADVRAAWERAGSAWWTAYAGARDGEAWLTLPGHRDAARDALARARGGAVALEAAPLLTDIESLATRGRLELAPPDPAVTRTGPDRKLPISDRELEVLALIARGLTNKQIASELFISERTAAHHVAHIFDKLGASSRVEAAGIAHNAGVLGDGGHDHPVPPDAHH